jgi:hypothetical protein
MAITMTIRKYLRHESMAAEPFQWPTTQLLPMLFDEWNQLQLGGSWLPVKLRAPLVMALHI